MSWLRWFSILIFLSRCDAQMGAMTGQLKGEVRSNTPRAAHGLVVSLRDSAKPETERAFVGDDGSFEFRNVRFGDYVITIESPDRTPIKQELISVHSTPTLVTLRLPERSSVNSPAATVSASRLRHQVPKPAYRAFAQAVRDSESGDHGKAMVNLRKAIELDPNYVEARTNLGVEYLRLGDPQSAVDEFRRSIAAGGSSGIEYSNLGYAHLVLKQYAEAEDAARTALRADPRNAKAHFVLGATLVRKPDSGPEGLKELRIAANDLPAVTKVISDVCRTGKVKGCM
jgi:hypothetical protein